MNRSEQIAGVNCDLAEGINVKAAAGLPHSKGKPHCQKRLEHKKRGAREGLPVLFGVLGVKK